VKIESEEEKKEIMKRKGKLNGDSLFIENDLSFEERKVQEKLSRWAKEKRNKGMEIKIDRWRTRYGGKWVTWKEIEKEERAREKEGKRGRHEGKGRRRAEGKRRRESEREGLGRPNHLMEPAPSSSYYWLHTALCTCGTLKRVGLLHCGITYAHTP